MFALWYHEFLFLQYLSIWVVIFEMRKEKEESTYPSAHFFVVEGKMLKNHGFTKDRKEFPGKNWIRKWEGEFLGMSEEEM